MHFDTLRYGVALDVAVADGMERIGIVARVFDDETERHLKIAASADTAEAFRAFVEKRKPVFQ